MNYAELFYEIRRKADRLTSDNIAIVAYCGPQAWHGILMDAELYQSTFFSAPLEDRVPEFCGIKLIRDKGSPEPELVKVFVDGVHLFTANTETEQLTEIRPSDDDLTVWQLAAIARYFGKQEAVSANSPVLRVIEPITPSLISEYDPESEPKIKSMIVHLGEMVGRGVLREDRMGGERVFVMTHQGRIACNAAMHFDALYHAESKRHWKSINRALMEM
jgi:hypothetical protein